mmetsp:Transcript_78752/g.228632  ORF Transcript_78752/g.228632 Transcript_78752/m.228632 type:complete len:258 (-) Transcript_78752:759-1532(-)
MPHCEVHATAPAFPRNCRRVIKNSTSSLASPPQPNRLRPSLHRAPPPPRRYGRGGRRAPRPRDRGALRPAPRPGRRTSQADCAARAPLSSASARPSSRSPPPVCLSWGSPTPPQRSQDDGRRSPEAAPTTPAPCASPRLCPPAPGHPAPQAAPSRRRRIRPPRTRSQSLLWASWAAASLMAASAGRSAGRPAAAATRPGAAQTTRCARSASARGRPRPPHPRAPAAAAPTWPAPRSSCGGRWARGAGPALRRTSPRR